MVKQVCDICGKEITSGATVYDLERQMDKEKRLRAALAMFHADGSRTNYRDICKDCSVAIDNLVQTLSEKGDAE